jgi:hypothetical protein
VQKEQGDNYPAWVIDKLGIEYMLANRVAMGRGLKPPRFIWVLDDALMVPLYNHAMADTPDRKFFYQREEMLLKRYLSESERILTTFYRLIRVSAAIHDENTVTRLELGEPRILELEEDSAIISVSVDLDYTAHVSYYITTITKEFGIAKITGGSTGPRSTRTWKNRKPLRLIYLSNFTRTMTSPSMSIAAWVRISQ